MNQEEDRVREEMEALIPFDPLLPDETPDVVTNKILSIKGLLIKADDQSLPKNPHWDYPLPDVYRNAQQDMLKDNWVKVKGGN